MAVYAVIDKKTNKVINHIVAEPEDILESEDHYSIDVKGHVNPFRGTTWDKNQKKFIEPPKPVIQKTPEELREEQIRIERGARVRVNS